MKNMEATPQPDGNSQDSNEGAREEGAKFAPGPAHRFRLLALLLLPWLFTNPAGASLEEELGRNEVRILSSPFQPTPGATVEGMDLAGRLEQLGYGRVRGRRPAAPGEYFWGHERFWIFRRTHTWKGKQYPAELLRLDLDRGRGTLSGIGVGEEGGQPDAPWLEPMLLAESLQSNRAARRPIQLKDLPERVWRPLLAIEDARFFDHAGVDSRSVARALLKNVKKGKISQGGSTLTQQLIKLRDLSPKRTLGRKLSEAVRALALEAEYEKTEILQAYLNHVYYGHLKGVEIYGIGAASHAFFGKRAQDLSLGEAALLAGIIQGPNGLSPVRNPERALGRYRQVLERLETLDWAETKSLREKGLPKLRLHRPQPSGPAHFLTWLREEVAKEAPKRREKGRGVVVESTLDPYLQQRAEKAVGEGLRTLRRRQRRLAKRPLSAALVALDAETGRVMAYVGGDPGAKSDAFDRARSARRQPGSTVKPFLLLEAFGDCGGADALFPARRVSDQPLTLKLPSGDWRPVNPDGEHRRHVTLREATLRSLNLPMVRVARHCGFEAAAETFRRAGLDLPAEAPPSFVLGAVEVSPLELASAYTVFGTLGERRPPVPIARLARPSGRGFLGLGPRARGVASAATTYLVRDLLEHNVEEGTAQAVRQEDARLFAKTGTSSDRRDAWLAGGGRGIVTIVWVGLDEGTLGLSATAAAAPIWADFMDAAIGSRPPSSPEAPFQIVERWIQDSTGLLVRPGRSGAHPDLFRRDALPPKRRIWREETPLRVID